MSYDPEIHEEYLIVFGGTTDCAMCATVRTRAIPERLRGVFTTRRYTNTRLPLPPTLQNYLFKNILLSHEPLLTQ